MNKGLSKYVSLIIGIAVTVSGCSYNASVNTGDNVINDYSEVESDNDIEVSNNVIDRDEILLNVCGYEGNAPKMALLRSECEDEYFEVVNADTQEAVYAGKIGQLMTCSAQEPTRACDFSDITEAGNYYIHISSIGDSSVFTIEKGLYRRILADRLSYVSQKESVTDSISENSLDEVIIGITDRLMAEQLFDMSKDGVDTGKSEGLKVMPRSLIVSKAEIDAIMNALESVSNNSIADNVSDKYELSAVFSLFAHLYSAYDKAYANEVCDKAVSLFNEAESGLEELDKLEADVLNDERYWAAAQLYKVSGSRQYREIAESYKDDIPIGFDEENKGYLGSLAYITSSYSTDYNISGIVIKSIMDEAIRVSSEIQLNPYYVISDNDYSDDIVMQVFANARLMVLANYISQSVDYISAAENQIEYLYGRNPMETDYAYSSSSIYYDRPQAFILSGLLSSYIYDEKQEGK